MEFLQIGTNLGATIAGAAIMFYGGYRAIRWVMPSGDEQQRIRAGHGSCPDHECQRSVYVLQHEVAGVKENQEKIFKAIDEMRDHVAFIRGRMEQLK